MATHWQRKHGQLIDIMPDSSHQHHLDAGQYDLLTRGWEATSLHHHVQLPLFVPLALSDDRTQIVTPRGGEGYPTGFGRRGFARVINPGAPVRVAPGTAHEVVYTANPTGWVSVWAYGERLLTAPVARVARWVDDRTVLLGEHGDPGSPKSWSGEGVNLDLFTSSPPFVWLFGSSGERLATTLASVSDDGTNTTLVFSERLGYVPGNGGQWVYLSPPVARRTEHVDASYLATLYWDGSAFAPEGFKLARAGVFEWRLPFYYSGSDWTSWADFDLSAYVPPTAVQIDLFCYSTYYYGTVGIYKEMNDANSLVVATQSYRSFTYLADNTTRWCSTLPAVPVKFDEVDQSSLRVVLFVSKYVTVAVHTVYEEL